MLPLVLLDASALLNAPHFSFKKNNSYLMPSSVFKELRNPEARLLAENALHRKQLALQEPSPPLLQKIRHEAGEKGFSRLSLPDLEVLALARELHGKRKEIRVLTDDYSIQNFLLAWSIPFQGISEKGVKGKIEFEFRCTGCGKKQAPGPLPSSCEDCGAPLERKRSTSPRIPVPGAQARP